MAVSLKKLTKTLTGQDASEGIQKQKFDRYWQSSSMARKELDWRWFNYDLWVSGNHYAKWDKNTQQILTSPKMDGRAKVVINKTWTTLRAVRSHVLQNQPKPEVTPFNLTPETTEEAAKLNLYLTFIHQRLHLGQKLRASMLHALKYSVGFWQVLYDEDEEQGVGGIVVNVVDPYDLYWDPAARYPAEARYVIMAVRRNIEDLKSDDKYKDADWDLVEADKQLSSSSLKSRLIQFERGPIMYDNKQKEDGTVIVKEFWYKENTNEEVEDEDPEQPGKTTKRTINKQKIMLCTMVGDEIIRKPFDTELDRFPFFRLASDIEPLSMYGQGWVKNLIPVNRLLDRLESSAAEYNDIINKGRLIADKGAGVRVITNEHGQIIEKKKGFEISPLPIQPLASILGEQIQNANRYIEDIGNMHDATLGRIPSGAKSGVSIEALQEGDSNNLSELTENTEEFLEDVYEYILYLASQKYQFARNVITSTTTGEKEFMKVIGAKASDEIQQQPGVTVIQPKNTVDVSITSWLAYTSEGRRQAVMNLSQAMNSNGYQLPADFILKAFETGEIANVVLQMEQKQAEQAQQQQQMQEQQQQSQMQGQMQMQQHQAGLQQQQQAQQSQMEQQQQQQQAQQGQAGAKEAIAFIKLLLNGQKAELPASIGPDFINYLDHFLNSPEASQLPGEILSVLEQDRDQAVLMMKQGQPGQVTQQTN